MTTLLGSMILALLLVGATSAQELVLADGGKSDWEIVIARDATPAIHHGAEELQHWLKEISGVTLPIVVADPATLRHRHQILLGDCSDPRMTELGTATTGLGLEGYVIRSAGDRLWITGGGPRGALYGVYGLLGDHLGCRWFTPQVSAIPHTPHLTLPPIDERVVPRLEYREPYVKDCFDPDWCARNRVNSNGAQLDERHGGKVTYAGFVHTFAELVPPAKYYHDHPEYFSLVDGRRQDGYAQLCCTNQEVIRIVTEEIRTRMRAHPEATVFSVSQNDTFRQCQCENCQALATAEGAQIAPVLQLVNQVAAAVAGEFPDKVIDTLAYQWTRKPPKSMRPRPNVVVRLCSIECCFSHPLATCDSAENRAFRDDLEGWSRVCNRLWVWDYTTSFANYFVPFPNRRVIGPNVRFFADHHVTGIFEEDTYSTPAGELNGLDGYLQARVLWDPQTDVSAARDEFLVGVYGAAAGPIGRYLELLDDEVATRNIHMHIWEGAHAAYLSDALLAAGDRLWEEAEAAVAGDPVVRERVRVARLSLDWAQIERAPQPVVSGYRIVGDKYAAEVDAGYRARVERFFANAALGGVTMLDESGLSLAAYRARVLPQVDGFDVVALQNDALEIDVVPALGGRIVGLRAPGSAVNLADNGDPGEGGYPNCGGYAESWQAAAQGPGWATPLVVTHTEGIPKHGLTLGGKLAEGVDLERTIAMSPAGPSFDIESELTDTRSDAPPSSLRASFSFAIGAIDDLFASTPALDADGRLDLTVADDMARRDIPLAPELAARGLRLIDRTTGVGVQVVPSGAAIERAWLRLDVKRSTVTCEWQVATGGGSLRQHVEVIHQQPALVSEVTVTAPSHRALRVEVGEDRIPIAHYGTWATIEADPGARSGFSIHLPPTHIEWCCQWQVAPAEFEAGTRYEVFAHIRVARTGAAGPAFWAGIHDSTHRADLGSIQPAVASIPDDEWHDYRLGEITPAGGQYLWCGPRGNAENVGGVWLDRFELRAVKSGH